MPMIKIKIQAVIRSVRRCIMASVYDSRAYDFNSRFQHDQFELPIDSVVNVEEQLDHQSQATKHWNKNSPDYR